MFLKFINVLCLSIFLAGCSTNLNQNLDKNITFQQTISEVLNLPQSFEFDGQIYTKHAEKLTKVNSSAIYKSDKQDEYFYIENRQTLYFKFDNSETIYYWQPTSSNDKYARYYYEKQLENEKNSAKNKDFFKETKKINRKKYLTKQIFYPTNLNETYKVRLRISQLKKCGYLYYDYVAKFDKNSEKNEIIKFMEQKENKILELETKFECK